MPSGDLLTTRQAYSDMRLKELRRRISPISSLSNTDGLTIYAAGSYGRLEASEGSDLDLFFLFNGDSSSTPLRSHRNNQALLRNYQGR
jgi:UTP:GlnB (protein PII) uridylyltransferase